MQRFKRGEIDILVVDDGDRGRHRRAERVDHADRRRRSLRPLAAAPAPRTRRARRAEVVLHPGARREGAAEAQERLKLFAETKDGFDVAERDLQIRGPGEFLGTRQSGVPRFRFGNIVRDHALMESARDVAIELLARDGVGTCNGGCATPHRRANRSHEPRLTLLHSRATKSRHRYPLSVIRRSDPG